MDGGFEIAAERVGGVVRLRLTGELDIARVEQLERAVLEARGPSGDQSLEIDLRELQFIDSSGLRGLLAVHNSAAEGNFTFRLISGPPKIHRTFVLTGLDKVFLFADAPETT